MNWLLNYAYMGEDQMMSLLFMPVVFDTADHKGLLIYH